jgi:hypothetical protein
MSTTRVLIKQGSRVYRFLRFETSADGSLLAFLDRDPRASRGRMVLSNGVFVPEANRSDRPSPSAKFSIHTTGEVHRYLGRERKSTIHIEPLYALTSLHLIGYVSIPRPARLDLMDETRHVHDVAAILDIPETISERISFVIEIGPKPQEAQTFGVALHYEVYSVVARVAPPPIAVSSEVADHFITGTRSTGIDKRQTDKAAAELAFYRAALNGANAIFREESGAYVILAAVPMRSPPRLSIVFRKDDLYVEQIPFDHPSQPTHKVRFWICDKGGRNKRDDLRTRIASIELDANS